MNKEFEELKIENNKIRFKIEDILDDLKLKETKDELWELISDLIENEIKQEELCE